VDTGDYSAFVDSEFGPATGLIGRLADSEAERLRQEADYQTEIAELREQNREDQIARDMALRTDIQGFLADQSDAERREEFAKAFTAPGRKVTEQQAPLANIGYVYDFAGDSLFANQKQAELYGSASPYGDNFLTDIIMPKQRRAKGGMIQDTTDEILKIIGDK